MLKIETENKKLIWKLPEKESDQLFTHLSLWLIELTGGVAKGAAERTEDIPELVPTGEKDKTTPRYKREQEPVETGKKYSGPLYIKCDHCGSEKGWVSKEPTKKHYCPDCGKVTVLKEENMHPLQQQCECGWSSKAMTNLAVDMADIKCPRCEYLIAVKWNGNKECYETIL